MEYYEIPTWKDYQHYKDRNPPWIKLHYSLLNSLSWVAMDDASRVLAIACMLIASRHDGKIPKDSAYVQRIAYLNKPPNFKPLINNGFLIDASTMHTNASTMHTNARPETETETETETNTDKEGETPTPPASSSSIFFDKWNQIAKQCSIPECVETETRKKTLRTRMKEKHFRENWQAALEKIKESSFCNGRNERLWKANVEWFLKPDTVAKILEGKYDFEFQQPGKPPPAMSRECMRPEDNTDIFGTPTTTKEKSK